MFPLRSGLQDPHPPFPSPRPTRVRVLAAFDNCSLGRRFIHEERPFGQPSPSPEPAWERGLTFGLGLGHQAASGEAGLPRWGGGSPRVRGPATRVQRALCAGLTAQNWGSPCKRLPSQTPPRPRPQPPSLRSPERSERRLCSCCSAHEILMRERLAGGGAPPPALARALPHARRFPAALKPHLSPQPPPWGSGPGGEVWPAVGVRASPPPRHKKGRARLRAWPPASLPAALP